MATLHPNANAIARVMTTEFILGAFAGDLSKKKLRKLKARLEMMADVYEHGAKVRRMSDGGPIVRLESRRPSSSSEIIINHAAMRAADHLREMLGEIERRLEDYSFTGEDNGGRLGWLGRPPMLGSPRSVAKSDPARG